MPALADSDSTVTRLDDPSNVALGRQSPRVSDLEKQDTSSKAGGAESQIKRCSTEGDVTLASSDKVEASSPPIPPAALAFDGPDDPDDPRNWSFGRRATITAILCFMTLTLTYTSSAYALSIGSIVKDVGGSREVNILGVSLYVLGFGVGPLVMGPLSEVVGRSPVYFATYFCFTAFSIGVGFCQTVPSLLILRFLSGFVGCSSLNNVPASIGDITHPHERNRFTIWYAVCAFGGPALSPCIAGFIEAFAPTWRWNLHICSLMIGASTVLGFIVLRETHHPTILKKRLARRGMSPPKMTSGQIVDMVKVAVTRPFIMVLTEPIVFLVGIYLSVLYGCLYGFFSSYQYVFMTLRGFTIWQYGLVYASVGIGFVIGGFVMYFPQHHVYASAARKAGGKPVPAEIRFVQAFWAGPLVPVSLFLFAWTAPYTNIHWIVPCVGMALYGLAMEIVFTSFIPYLVDGYRNYAASALAAGTAMRAIFGCIFPLFTLQMNQRLTVQGAGSLLAGITLLLAPLPYVFWRIGHRLRMRSNYAYA